MRSIFIMGFGKVGRQLVRILLEEYHSTFMIVGVSSSKGTLLPEGPGDRANLLRLAREARRLDEHPSFIKGLPALEAAISAAPDIVMIAIPPNYRSGEPNITIYKELLKHGISIVTADKTALSLQFRQIINLAINNNAGLGYRATVMAGTPALDIVSALQYREVNSIRAVLNATSNYVLGLVEKGLTLDEAIKRSIEAGLAEPDPRIDLDGWDAAAKLTIIANTLGLNVSINHVQRQPLKSINVPEKGKGRLKQVAYLKTENGLELRVEPVVLPNDDPLSEVEGEENILEIRLEGNRIILRGPAGPDWRTARVMIADALEIINGGVRPLIRPAS